VDKCFLVDTDVLAGWLAAPNDGVESVGTVVGVLGRTVGAAPEEGRARLATGVGRALAGMDRVGRAGEGTPRIATTTMMRRATLRQVTRRPVARTGAVASTPTSRRPTWVRALRVGAAGRGWDRAGADRPRGRPLLRRGVRAAPRQCLMRGPTSGREGQAPRNPWKLVRTRRQARWPEWVSRHRPIVGGTRTSTRSSGRSQFSIAGRRRVVLGATWRLRGATSALPRRPGGRLTFT